MAQLTKWAELKKIIIKKHIDISINQGAKFKRIITTELLNFVEKRTCLSSIQLFSVTNDYFKKASNNQFYI